MIAAVTAVGLLVLVPRLRYPAAMFAMAGFVRSRAAEAPVGAWQTVTRVLATRAAPDVVRERVADFPALGYPLELLDAVDATGAAVLTTELADAGGPRTRVVVGAAPGGECPALNAAMRAASGDLLICSDARQHFEPDVARKLAAALLADPRLATASGRLLLPVDADGAGLFHLYSRLELNRRAAEARLHSVVGVSGSIYAV